MGADFASAASSCAILGSNLTALSLGSPICKMGITPILQGYREESRNMDVRGQFIITMAWETRACKAEVGGEGQPVHAFERLREPKNLVMLFINKWMLKFYTWYLIP